MEQSIPVLMVVGWYLTSLFKFYKSVLYATVETLSGRHYLLRCLIWIFTVRLCLTIGAGLIWVNKAYILYFGLKHLRSIKGGISRFSLAFIISDNIEK